METVKFISQEVVVKVNEVMDWKHLTTYKSEYSLSGRILLAKPTIFGGTNQVEQSSVDFKKGEDFRGGESV